MPHSSTAGPRRRVRTGPPDEVERPFYKTWWFWTIVGVGVAAGIAGIVVATSGGGDPNGNGNGGGPERVDFSAGVRLPLP